MLKVQEILQMTTGVGDDTYEICMNNCHFILKVSDVNEIDHPEEEPAISFMQHSVVQKVDMMGGDFRIMWIGIVVKQH